MVVANCVIAHVGDFEEPCDPTIPPWDGGECWDNPWNGTWVNPDYLDPVQPIEPPGFRPPKGTSIPIPPFDTINVPTNIYINVPGSYEYPLSQLEIPSSPGNIYQYTAYFVDPAGDSDTPVNEIPLTITGALQDELSVTEGLDEITGLFRMTDPSIEGLTAGHPGQELSIGLLVPDSEDALSFYQDHKRFLDSLVMSVEYILVLDATLIGTNLTEEIARFKGSFAIAGNIIIGVQPPVIEYAEQPTIIYNVPAGQAEVTEIIPSIWELNGNVITNNKIEIVTVRAGYNEDIIFYPDPEDPIEPGTLQFPGSPLSLRNLNLSLIRLSIFFDKSPPVVIEFRSFNYEGYSECDIDDDCEKGSHCDNGICVPDEPQGPPVFDYGNAEGTLYYNAPPGTEPFILTPQGEWNYNGWDPMGVRFQFYSFSVLQGEGTAGSWGGGNPSLELGFDPLTGEITITPYAGVFDTALPGDHIAFYCGVQGAGDYFEIGPMELPLNLEEWSGLALTAGGGSAPRKQSPPKVPYTSAPNLLGYKSYNNIKRIPLSNEKQSRLRRLTTFSNGILNPKYTFMSAPHPTSFLPVAAPNKKQYSILSKTIDSTVRDILSINTGEELVNDYSYNALTSDKVFRSLSPAIQTVLKDLLAFDGTPLSNMVIPAIYTALIRGEIDLFSSEDIASFASLRTWKTPTVISTDSVSDHVAGLDIVINNSGHLDPLAYTNLKTRNRLYNWKTLAEDTNKRIVFKTGAGTETNIYIPNNEKITVITNQFGGRTEETLEMQDGDYFVAIPLEGYKRLSVFSDISKAKVLNPINKSRAAKLLGEDISYILEASSVTSSLVEYNVDTSVGRQDYYFLKLDKDTIEDVPTESYTTRTTKASFDYTTTGIGEFTQYKAFPCLPVYLMHDDMLFNHIEVTKKVQLTSKDFSFNKVNNPIDDLLIRSFPQHILLVPTDRTEKTFHQRSKLVDFNTRRVRLGYHPFLTQAATIDHPYLEWEYNQDNNVNFGEDKQNNVIWQEKGRYSFPPTKVEAISRYVNGEEPLPRPIMPTGQLLQRINSVKMDYSLTGVGSIVQSYDIFTRLEPYVYKSLYLDQEYSAEINKKLLTNSLTDDDEINNKYFLPLIGASLVEDADPLLLPEKDSSPVVKKKFPWWTATPVPGIGPTDDDRVPFTEERSESGGKDDDHLLGGGGGGSDESGPYA